MKQIKKFSDSRLEGVCIYCGGKPETRDHVPSKILMDKPFPNNLPVVPACDDCNQNFSKDEEYFACLIECILRGTTKIELLQRKKIKNILREKPALRQRLTDSIQIKEGQIYFKPEENRIRNVILKLARGHATFENSELKLEEPIIIEMKPLTLMSENEINVFFTQDVKIIPEVGSRAFQRMFIYDESMIENWLIVQENKYMYSINDSNRGFSVKFVIWNYLACEVIWQ